MAEKEHFLLRLSKLFLVKGQVHKWNTATPPSPYKMSKCHSFSITVFRVFARVP